MSGAYLRLEAVALSDVGLVRSANEDSFCALPHYGVWAVADGMGGHARGEWASGAIVEALAATDPGEDFDGALGAVAAAIHAANGRIHSEAEATGSRMGSTVVALLLRGRQFGIVWAGDSRAYLLRDGQLHRLTKDHSQVQQMLDRGLLSEAEAQGHPMGHVLARAVGVEATLELDAIADAALAGDIYLLCSDGVHGVLADDEIASLLGGAASGGPGAMASLVRSRGAPDNLTIVTVTASEPTLLNLGNPEPAGTVS